MDSLLRWGIENSAPPLPGAPPAVVRNDLDPAIIDHILGKPDAVLMKEALAVAVDETKGEDERMEALDNLEMLVENIDNANDLGKLKMWRPLQDLITSPASSPQITMQALWVVGTALQNNPSAQTSYLSLEPIPTLISLLRSETTSAQTRSKAVYALSGLLKHNAAAIGALGDEGWSALRVALEDSDITVRRKTAFLINTLLLPTHAPPPAHISASATSPRTAPQIVHPNSHASMLSDPDSTSTSAVALSALQNNGVLDGVISGLAESVPFGEDGDGEGDLQFEETCIRIVYTYTVSCEAPLSVEQKEKLARFISGKEGDGDGGAARWSLVAGEYDDLRRKVGLGRT